MSTTWNEQPPAAPPVTDTDPCLAWGAPHQHPHDHGAAPLGEPGPGASPYNWYGYGAPTAPPPLPVATVPKRRGTGARVAVTALAVTGLLGVGFASRGLIDPATSPIVAAGSAPSTAPAASNASTPLVKGNDEEPVTAVAKALGPSIVVIKNDQGLGSGVVYDSKGLILTNAHVVGTATQVAVTLPDGTTLEGSVLGADTDNDIAVVKVQPTSDLAAARLATDDPEVGELAVAMGSPFGLDHTVTAGVVSAVNRPVDNGAGSVASMIQTDAPINPGNSGGALANRHGEVIGINSQIYSQKGENNGIGFAIPIAKAKQVADALAGGGSVSRAYLGVSSKAAADGSAGAAVAEVTSGSAAATAGLKVGDVITAVDGTAVKESSDLAAVIGAHEPGDKVSMTVTRNGTSTTVSVTLGTKPANSGQGSQGGSPTTPQK